MPHSIQPFKALLISAVIYAIWQTLYWKLVLVDRRTKIQSGQRTTSFSFLLNDKRGAIGRALSSVKPQYREAAFMAGQLGELIVLATSNHQSTAFSQSFLPSFCCTIVLAGAAHSSF